jgi:hypothetical protein
MKRALSASVANLAPGPYYPTNMSGKVAGGGKTRAKKNAVSML